jgi:hypothetical protein
MKSHKSTILIMLLGLLLMAFVAVMGQQTPAQNPQVGEQKKMESCCCKDDSCELKKEGAEAGEAKEDCCGDSCKLHHADAKNTATGNNEVAKHDPAKHDPAKPDSAKHEGCCGESCDMAKHGANHDPKTHKADGSCCKMKQKDARKEAKAN